MQIRNILALSALVFFPLFAYAQGLVPCGGPGQDECQACHLVILAQNGLELLVSISAGIAVVAIAFGGLLLATSGANESQRSRARSIFTNVGIGFIIVLASWLIVDTVMKTFTGGGTQLGPWNEISCVALPEYEFVREGNAAGGTYDPATGGEVTDSDGNASFAGSGISVVSSGNCSDASRTDCTSLTGMRSDTIQQILNIQSACPTCGIVVTGGTEAGHAGGTNSHGNGYKIDLSDNDAALNSYLQSNLTQNGVRGGSYGGTRYRDSCGNEYVRESNHWDISVTGGACGF